MKRRYLLLGLVGAFSACYEPYSNDDLLFLYDGFPRSLEIAVPTEDGTTGVQQPGGPPPPETALFYGQARTTADAINRDVLSLLTVVDEIVMQPPSQRNNDQRVWGPIPGDRGVLLTLVSDRVRTSTVVRATSTSTPAAANEFFDYVMLGSSPLQTTPQPLFSGRQVVDSIGSGVQGLLFLDLNTWQTVDPAQQNSGEIFVAYDDRYAQLTMELYFGNLSAGETPVAASRHTNAADGSGSLFFITAENVIQTTDAKETWVTATRWRGDGSGRADVLLTDGDVAAPLFAIECWDANFYRTYMLSNIQDPQLQPFGRLEACGPDLQTSHLPP